jgi:hypothetical protein
VGGGETEVTAIIVRGAEGYKIQFRTKIDAFIYFEQQYVKIT